MRIISFIGGLMLVIGLALVIWGIVQMYDGRDKLDLERDAEIVFDDGDFPRVGVNGAILGAVGIVVLALGTYGSRRRTR